MTAPFPFDAWARPGKDTFEFWISFFPTAPLFGVEWRFADISRPAMAPFMQAGATPFAMPFPVPFAAAGAAAAAARPGELDSPAEADDAAAQPVARTADAAADIVADAGRIASDTGRAAMRTVKAAVNSGADAAEVPADAGRDPAPAEAEVAGSPADAVADLLTGSGEEVSTEALAEEKAEARLATRSAAETAVDEAPHAETGPEAVDAAIAAAPRPAVLLDERPDHPDDLKALRGIGAGLERQLNGLGVWKLEQIARMTDADLAWIDANLTTIPGRAFRDDWVGQAKARLGK